jgi:uncharacterized protein
MFRLLFWIALISIIFWLWRKHGRTTPQTAAAEAEPTAMVRCAHCRLHLPRDQALPHAGAWYCSRAHADQGPAPRAD